MGDQRSAIHQLGLARPHIAALPLPVQKIRTVELDGKVIKLQIVSACPGAGGGKARQWRQSVPACATH